CRIRSRRDRLPASGSTHPEGHLRLRPPSRACGTRSRRGARGTIGMSQCGSSSLLPSTYLVVGSRAWGTRLAPPSAIAPVHARAEREGPNVTGARCHVLRGSLVFRASKESEVSREYRALDMPGTFERRFLGLRPDEELAVEGAHDRDRPDGGEGLQSF